MTLMINKPDMKSHIKVVKALIYMGFISFFIEVFTVLVYVNPNALTDTGLIQTYIDYFNLGSIAMIVVGIAIINIKKIYLISYTTGIVLFIVSIVFITYGRSHAIYTTYNGAPAVINSYLPNGILLLMFGVDLLVFTAISKFAIYVDNKKHRAVNRSE